MKHQLPLNIPFCLIIIMCLFSINVFAQNNRATQITTKNGTINAQTSITRSQHSYQFKAHFDPAKHHQVASLLLERLGQQGLIVQSSTHRWQRLPYFNCSLKKGSLLLNLDKEKASKTFYKSINTLGEELRTLLTQHQSTFASSNNGMDPQLARTSLRSKDPQLNKQLQQAEIELAKAQEKLDQIRKKIKKEN